MADNRNVKVETKKKSKKGGVILFFYKLLYLIAHIAVFLGAWLTSQSWYFITGKTTMFLVVVFAIALAGFLTTYSAFEVHKTKPLDLCVKHFLSLALSDIIIFLAIIIALRRLPDLSDLVLMVPVQILLTVIWCVTAVRIHFAVHPAAETIVVYSDELAYESIKSIHKDTKNFHVIKTINLNDFEGDIAQIKEILLEAELVVLCGILLQERNNLFKYLIDHNKEVIVRPSIGDVFVSTAEREYLCNVPVLTYDSGEKPLFTRAFKRAVDILMSSLMLVFASPVMLLVALAIKIEDRGPVFYKQQRLTKNAKVFKIIKFRSMRVDAEKDGVARLAADKDDRITKVGKFIRATRIDELPQLINILKGEMSLIGPRPERPEIASQYEENLPEFALRLKVKAGLTGYAQVYGKYNTTPYDKLQMDLMYVADMSFFTDIKLILLTVQVMFQKDSTEGIEKGNTTAAKEKTKK